MVAKGVGSTAASYTALYGPKDRPNKAVNAVATFLLSPLTKTSRHFGQDMASLDNKGQDMARFVANDDPLNNDPTNHEGVGETPFQG